MIMGKCAFQGCKNDTTTSVSENGKQLLVCHDHNVKLSELHDEAMIEAALGIGSITEINDKEEEIHE